MKDNKVMDQDRTYPRLMLTAGASGSGKTLITCGILQALKERGLDVASFKCGPDYIDPLFHTTVLGTRSRNLDTFFTGEETTRCLFEKNAAGADISVIEGVMGYYDGLGGISAEASAWDVARVTDTPAVLIVSCKGMSLSVIPYIKGFLEYRSDSRIRGVILNRISPMIYPRLAALIREQLRLEVFGYVPETDELRLESRHLGLVLPEEVDGIREKLSRFAQILEKTLDIDSLLRLARSAPAIRKAPTVPPVTAAPPVPAAPEGTAKPRIAVARDEAFCFLYEDNLELLEEFGAQLVFFSPLHDETLPEADGLLLCGGYPELYAEKLSANTTMLSRIREAVAVKKLPCMAECGGFMYLMQEMEDMEGRSWPMAGVLAGKAFRTKKLNRFGYITLTAHALPEDKAGQAGQDRQDGSGWDVGPVRGHEFHYFDTTDNGRAFYAEKPVTGRGWDCMHAGENLLAGFPHLYYYSNPGIARRFVEKCRKGAV